MINAGLAVTGLANPGPIVSSFYMDQTLPDRVRLDGIVTVVDAKHVTRHLDESEKDPERVSEAVEQVIAHSRVQGVLDVACLTEDP